MPSKDKDKENVVKFFSYVVNENIEMLRALFGRKDLLYEDAILPGYELCIQNVNQISNKVFPRSPIKISPRKIIKKNFGENYELYVIRSNSKKSVPGKIWYVSKKEYEYLREWEMIDYGMSQDITAKATTSRGDKITVNTYGLTKKYNKISRVITSDYRRKEAPSKEKLKNIRRVRKEYIKRMKKNN